MCGAMFFYEEFSGKCVALALGNRTYVVTGSKNGNNGNNNQKTATQCLPGCLTCSPLNLCTSCLTGFSLSSLSSECIPCENNCLTCFPHLPSSCLSCYKGFFLEGVDCLPCDDEKCVECEADRKLCTKCVVGYFVKDKQCQVCSENCYECDFRGQCTSCVPGYGLSTATNTCIRCLDSCQSCHPTLPSKCLPTCPSTYYYPSPNTTTTQCLPCPSTCLTCSSPTNCTRCLPPSILKQNTCTLPCEEGCF